MGVERRERAQAAAKGRLAREAAESLRRVEETFPDAAEAMGWFREAHRRAFVRGEPPAGAGVPVGTTCIQVPLELLRAVGARPVRLCAGAHAWEPAGADYLPAKGCPLVRSMLGRVALGEPGLPRLVVNVSSCDQKRKAGEVLEELGREVHHLELPPSTRTEGSRQAWRQEVARLAGALSAHTGIRLTRRRLADAVAEHGSARRAFRRLHELRRRPAPAISGTEVILVAGAFFLEELGRWTEAVDRLADELERRPPPAPSRPRPRLLFTGSPPVFPNLKLPLLLEQAGGWLVADEVCSGSRPLHDAVHVAEAALYDMLPALADRYLKPCTCPVFVSGEDRRRRLVELAGTFGIQGAVYQTFTGCHPFEMEQRGVRAALERAGVPTLAVETDYAPEDEGQLATRVEAFLESLRAHAGRS